MKKKIEKYHDIPIQVKASLWFVICGFVQKAISLLTTPVFFFFFTTFEYGVFSVFISWQTIITIFASLNLASGVYLRGLIKYEKDEEEFTASLQSLFIVAFAICFGVYFVGSGFWNQIFDLPTKYVLLMYVDILFQTSFQFWSCRQRVKFKYRSLVMFTLVNAVLRPVLGIIAVIYSPHKVSARIYTMVLADCIVFGCFFIAVFWNKGKKIPTKYWRYSLSYNLPLVPHYLSQFVLSQSDRLMINSLTNSEYAGIYSLAYSMATVLTIANQSILNSYNPWMYQKIRDKQYDNIGKVSYTLLLIIAGLNLVLIICAPEVIAIMAPPAYRRAIWVIPPVAMATYFMFLYSLFANFEFYYEKTKYMMMASVSGAILNIVLNYFFIRKYGFIAAGYTTVFCYLSFCLAHYVLMRKILKKELPQTRIYDMKIIIAISLGFIMIGVLFMTLYDYVFIRYSVIAAVMIVCMIKRKQIIGILKELQLSKQHSS